MRSRPLVPILLLMPLPSAAALGYSVEAGPPEAVPAPPAREVTAVGVDDPIILDGVLDEACWQTGLWIDEWLVLDGAGKRPEAQTQFKVRYDDGNVYIGVRADEPNMESLRETYGAARDEPVYNDDCIEVWVDPHNQRRRAYHLILSVAGGVWDGVQWEEVSLDPQAPLSSARKLTRHEDKAWNGSARAAFARAEDGWTCEVRVPAADFGLPGVIEGSTWGLNIGRERWAFEQAGRAENSSLTGTFAWPMTAFAALELGVSPVEVSNLRLGAIGVGENVLRFECRAPRKELRAADVRITARDAEERSVRFTVPLDGVKPVTVVRTYALSASSEARVTLEVLRPDSQEVVFRTSAERDLMDQVRAYPRSNLAFIGPEPWWVDLELRVGEASLARGRLQVEVRSAAGRVRHRQRLKDLRQVMRLTFKPRAIGPAGEYTLRFIVLDGKQELGRAELPLRLLRPAT